jgi:DNA-binding transcriptional regulator YdaS (Cro superfamily)
MERSLGRTKLRRLLRGHGSQTSFAERSGVPQSQLSLYVRGDRRPGLGNALKIETATRGAISAADWRKPERAARKAPARAVARRSTLNDKNAPQGT